MGDQQIFSHLLVITEFTRVLATLAAELKRGMWLTEGLRVMHSPTSFSAVPDGTFILERSLRSGRVRLVEGAEEGYVRIEGAPDVVLEVVSPSSEPKDTVQLRNDYWEIGVREYWLVDARNSPPAFDILRHSKKGYVASKDPAGWAKSAVFRKSFRLTEGIGILGHPQYTLSVP